MVAIGTAKPASVESSRPGGAEERFLVQCLIAHFSPRVAAPAIGTAGEINWPRLFELASRHNVSPLLYRAILKDRSSRAPSAAVGEVADLAKVAALRSMSMAGDLAEVMGAFEAAGIKALAIKGPVIAMRNYGDLGLRSSVDLDVLIDPQDLARAAGTLSKMGFAGWNIDPHMLPAYLRSSSEHCFFSEERQLYLDLHWALSPPFFPLSINFADLWARQRSTRIGSEIRSFSAEDTLLFLCFHGTKHLWSSLALVCDVAAVLRSEPAINWDQTLAAARTSGSQRILLLGLYLANKILACELPDNVGGLITRNRKVQRLGERACAAIFNQPTPQNTLAGELSMCTLYLRSRERWTDKGRLLLRLAEPNVRDWKKSKLPAAFLFLHIFTKPVRHLAWLWRSKKERPLT